MLFELTGKQQRILRWTIIVYLVVLNTHSFFLEPSHISPVKVGCMALAPFIFAFILPVFSKAVICGLLYWVYCYLSALMHGDMRFSTIGYMGLFVATFIVFYNSIYRNVMGLGTYKKIIKYLIYAFAVCLLLQQACLIVGISNFPLINLIGGSYMQLGKIPSLSLEPSHTAIILSFAFLCYLRCCQIEFGSKPTLIDLFNRDNRYVTLGFLWVMLTMGSGSAYFGLAGLMFYFLDKRNIIIVISLILIIGVAMPYIENEQAQRALKISRALVTGDRKLIVKSDGSGASRIIPLLNTFTKPDLTQMSTWFGHGTLSKNDSYKNAWRDLDDADYLVIPTVRQYGFIGWIFSLILVYGCCIRRFFSIETFLWFTLGMATLGNVYFHWGIMLMMTGIKYYETFYWTEAESDRIDG
ncbi:hypothetical protein [uncultured Coprobacter sp.]|jgi:hypothetical protein|uniref:hypothetical protein n=1 Tax=uncultured Coprobacter sp. TaxID=1720550 RepID=UPI0025E88A85|nr:hypothetical protein [uncultured Coprobacter sp.]